MTREEQLLMWVSRVFANRQYSVDTPLKLDIVSGDASFRRYFRVSVFDTALGENVSYIAVDAPPEKENSAPFIAIARGLKAHNVLTPEILASDLEQGFMLLSDLGDKLLWPALTEATADAYYQEAMLALLDMQNCQSIEGYRLPLYDAVKLNEEMMLFPYWCVSKQLNITLAEADIALLDQTMNLLIDSALEQPQVFVHRDYHSRNIMLCESASHDNGLGIIDFQDAVIGPITYDLVSILKDCYIEWPRRKVMLWVKDFYVMLTIQHETLMEGIKFDQFLKWFDWMGLQRHIKVLGIFCRLSIRDGKKSYLNDMPLTAKYVWHTLKLYPELSDFQQWFGETILTAMADHPEFDMSDVVA